MFMSFVCFFFLMIRRPPRSTLFPTRRSSDLVTDAEILAWVKAHARPLTDEDIRQWNERILNGGPKDEAARQRFQARRAEIAAKRGVPVEQLPRTATWVDNIELDEKRM